MNYNTEDIEDQLLATLKENQSLNGVTINTHAGEVSMRMFLDPTYYEGVIALLPFIFVKYSGRKAERQDDLGLRYFHELTFDFIVGADSLRNRQESQRSCYGMLRYIYDSIHGKWCHSMQTLADEIPRLAGEQITSTNFRQLQAFFESESRDERLIVELPKLTVYSTSYTVMVQA